VTKKARYRNSIRLIRWIKRIGAFASLIAIASPGPMAVKQADRSRTA